MILWLLKPVRQSAMIRRQLIIFKQLPGDELMEAEMVETVGVVSFDQELADRTDGLLKDLVAPRFG